MATQRDFHLMVTSAGGELVPQLVRLAKTSQRHRIRVVAVDAHPDIAARHIADAFATVPFGDEKGYAQAVAGIVAREGIDLIIPGSDEEAMALAAALPLFADHGCQVAVSDPAVMATIANKAATYRTLAAAGIRVPRWREIAEADQIPSAVRDAARDWGDVVVKPVAARGGRGVAVISGSENESHGGRERRLTLERFVAEVAPSYRNSMPVMVMERLLEPVYDIDMLGWRGEPVRLVPRRRVSSTLPNAGHVFVHSPELKALGDQVVRALHLTWLYDCDIMMGADGTPWILEVNPRPSGSWAVSIVAGVPLLDDMISLAKGENVGPIDDPAGSTVIPYKALLKLADGHER